MKTPVDRQTVDLSAFPALVVIYLGMRVRTSIDTTASPQPEALRALELAPRWHITVARRHSVGPGEQLSKTQAGRR
jgi:hypothetical protein